jgi:hypothetical protein
MHLTDNLKYMIATVALLLLGAGFAFSFYGEEMLETVFPPTSKEVHVHSDFAFYVADNKINLTAQKYQSSPESVKHPTMHFHDGVDNMIHRHAEGITLGEFMDSIGIELSDSCVKLDTGEQYCSNQADSLVLFVNGKKIESIASYVTQEEDLILLYYGDPGSPKVTEYQNSITDEACMYSGNCPERGEPPFESCGLTCEI